MKKLSEKLSRTVRSLSHAELGSVASAAATVIARDLTVTSSPSKSGSPLAYDDCLD